MNDAKKEVDSYLRLRLKESIRQCSVDQVMLFKRMYSHGNLERDIDSAIGSMPSDKLEWALQQVLNTLKTKKEE